MTPYIDDRRALLSLLYVIVYSAVRNIIIKKQQIHPDTIFFFYVHFYRDRYAGVHLRYD